MAGCLYIIQVLRRAGSKPPGYLPHSVMASSAQIMMLFFTLAGSLVLASGFFLPNWSSTFSKKPETNSWASSQMLQQDYHHGQGYALGGGAALPLAVPYPVPVPAQVQMSPPSPLSLSSMQSQAYHNMQLVPCLCSVPKEEIDNLGSVTVQSSQPVGN